MDHLRRNGVPPREIDGGWAVNGWLQYAHAENAVRGPNGDVRVNWVNDDSVPSRYQIVNAARPGWTVDNIFVYTRWASPSGAIYVLER